MKRPKVSFVPSKLSKLDLESFADSLLDDQPSRLQKVQVRRWRRLKHQLV